MSTSYDAYSMLQMVANQRHVQLILEGLRQVDTSGEVITLADYGSATGLNSMRAFTTAFQTFRETSNTPILVYHTDLPDNPWSVLFTNALTSPHSYLSLPNTYVAGVGRSFYEKLFPSNSISLMHTANCIHWLSTRSSVRGQLKLFIEDDETILSELRALSDADLNRFLSLRSEELKPGGRLILHAYTSPFKHSFRYYALLRMQEEGLISPEPLLRASIYSFPTSVSSITAAVSRLPCLRITDMQEYEFHNQLYREYETDGDANKYGERMAKIFRAVQEPITKDLLKDESYPGKDLTDVYFEYTADHLRLHPDSLFLKQVDVIIDKTA